MGNGHPYGRQQPEDEVLHHSDRGSQYASYDYQQQLQIYSIRSSMSRKGNCYDNACIESFHSIFKKEMIYLNKYNTREEAQKSIFEYIELFYNRKQIHSAIEYFAPDEYEHGYYACLTDETDETAESAIGTVRTITVKREYLCLLS